MTEVAEKVVAGIGGLLLMLFYVVVLASPLVWLEGAAIVTWGRRKAGEAEVAIESAPVPSIVGRLAGAALGVLAAGALAGAGVVATFARPGLPGAGFGAELLIVCAVLYVVLFALYVAAVALYVGAFNTHPTERPRWLLAWAWILPPAAMVVTAGLFLTTVSFVAARLGGD